MNLQNMRWPVIVGTMVITLGALFGTGFVLKNRTVDGPLMALYTNASAVESYKTAMDGDRYIITLKLKDTPDIEQAYKQLDQDTKKTLKGTPYTLIVEDHRNAQLEQVNRRVNLYVQEALATGQFATMADKVEQEAIKVGATGSASVDSDRVYVQVKAKDGYLYNVVSRPKDPLQSDLTQKGVAGL